MKKLVLIVLSMLMVLSMFACQNTKPAATTEEAPAAAAATEAPAADTAAPAEKTTQGMKIATINCSTFRSGSTAARSSGSMA